MTLLPFRFSALLASGAALAVVMAAGAPLPARSQEIVQALPLPAAEALNDALRRLSRNPESVPALVEAGRASLQLDDVEAALGFFSRAQSVAPEDGRVLVGLALVAVRRGEAPTALQLFRNAEAAGEHMAPHAAERGLAYDLVGSNERAQRLYRLSLSQEENAEVLRRLALSYAIAGNSEASEATLLPLLQRQDRASYRTRAFALAIGGRNDEAVAIAETMLPPRLSQRLAPYFRYMPRLTRAQQAAAANLGRFPDADEVGRDSREIAAYADSGNASSPATSSGRAQPGDRLEPRGEPLGPSAAQQGGNPRGSSQPAPSRSVAMAQVEVNDPTTPTSGELPAIAQAAATQSMPASSAAGQGAVSAFSAVAVAAQEAQPSFSLIDRPGSSGEAAQLADGFSVSEPAVVDLAEAFADFTLERAPMPSMAGAVDITTIDPPRERPAPVRPAAPVHPARHWVQVATGQDTGAFRFDWRRIVRNSGGLLDDAVAFTAKWNQTNRLLVGPYANARAAQEMVSKLAQAGVDSFRFASEEGEQVQALD